MNIKFFTPVRVIMEDDCITKNSRLFSQFGRKALIVTGKHSAADNGSLQDIKDALTTQGIGYSVYDRVMPNPTVACVYEGASFARENHVDFVIGIGGGSPMDAAKAIALLAKQEIPKEELFLNKFGKQALPLIMVPTTAGTGSEVTANSILSSDILKTKRSISDPILFPQLALLDAKYTKHLPVTVTINTALDALSHAVEGMLSVRSNELSNYIAVESIRIIAGCLKLLPCSNDRYASELSADIREKLLYASMLAGMVIAQTGTTAVHSMGYSLTYYKNIDHGRANALLLPGFLKFTAVSDQELVNQILMPMGMNSIDEFEALFTRLIGEREKITRQELEQFTQMAAKAKSITNSKVVPTKEDIYRLYADGLQSSENGLKH